MIKVVLIEEVPISGDHLLTAQENIRDVDKSSVVFCLNGFTTQNKKTALSLSKYRIGQNIWIITNDVFLLNFASYNTNENQFELYVFSEYRGLINIKKLSTYNNITKDSDLIELYLGIQMTKK